MYIAQESEYKQAVRDKLFKMITSHCPANQKMNAVTLCNTAFYLERRLIEHYKNCTIDCFERDKEIFRKIAETPNMQTIYPYCEDIFNAKFEDDKYSFVWLDFCNSYTDDFMTKLVTLLQRIPFANKAVLSITLSKNRGQAESDMVYNSMFPNYKEEGFAHHMRLFLPPVEKISKIKYACVDISEKSSSMNVFNFLINKNL